MAGRLKLGTDMSKEMNSGSTIILSDTVAQLILFTEHIIPIFITGFRSPIDRGRILPFSGIQLLWKSLRNTFKGCRFLNSKFASSFR